MTLLVQRSDVGEFRRRYRWLALVVVCAFLVLAGRLAELQLVEGDVHAAQARRNIVGEITLATTRGVIRDAYGKVLAANRPSYNVYVVPGDIDLEATWPRVVKLMGLGDSERGELEKRILTQRSDPVRDKQQMLLKVDVDRDVVAALKTHEATLRGVEVSPAPVRYYPYGELAAHLIGYMREIDPETLSRLEDRGYRAGDQIGAVGIERRWESYLRGQRGSRKVLRGRVRGTLDRDELEAKYLEEPRRVQPIPGRDISLSIDIELEQAIERAMRGQLAGAVAVVDVRTGRVLAALSKPSFDLNVTSGGTGKKAVRDAFRRLYADPLKPMLDKTISAAYPPGSTFKPFSALAAMESHLLDPRDRVDCRGGYEYGKRYFRCTGVHRNVNLHEAIVESCNTYFYRLGEVVTIDPLAKVGMDFGFGAKTGVGVNPEARGRMPTRSWYTRRYKGFFRGGYSLLAAIGQGATTVTVLQLALAYAVLANGGTLYQPQVVRSIETSDGTVVQEFPPRVRRMVSVDPGALALVKDAMAGVVSEREGTAHHAALPGVDVAGKTGTAQVSHVTPRGVDKDRVWYFNRDHAWFAGYAPSRSPELAIVVLVEHGGGGGKNAAPIAMKVVEAWQKLKAKRLEARVSIQPSVKRPGSP
ncbi:MAG: penicillin-binding protein 2 [Sorangiineae bacterium]|nr:penicillin-binding protein 2 [Polyangiaceae bacterium]MEB2321393.1 penicillin-binding protein 2 [Sorangiineae bacterium]